MDFGSTDSESYQKNTRPPFAALPNGQNSQQHIHPDRQLMLESSRNRVYIPQPGLLSSLENLRPGSKRKYEGTEHELADRKSVKSEPTTPLVPYGSEDSDNSKPCGNCGRHDHEAAFCRGPTNSAGYIQTCPLCNEPRTSPQGAHLVDECPQYLDKGKGGRRSTLFHFSVLARVGIAPLAMRRTTWEVVAEKKGYDYSKGVPLSAAESLRKNHLMEYVTFDYKSDIRARRANVNATSTNTVPLAVVRGDASQLFKTSEQLAASGPNKVVTQPFNITEQLVANAGKRARRKDAWEANAVQAQKHENEVTALREELMASRLREAELRGANNALRELLQEVQVRSDQNLPRLAAGLSFSMDSVYGDGSVEQYGPHTPDTQVEAAAMELVGSGVKQEDEKEEKLFAHPH